MSSRRHSIHYHVMIGCIRRVSFAHGWGKPFNIVRKLFRLDALLACSPLIHYQTNKAEWSCNWLTHNAWPEINKSFSGLWLFESKLQAFRIRCWAEEPSSWCSCLHFLMCVDEYFMDISKSFWGKKNSDQGQRTKICTYREHRELCPWIRDSYLTKALFAAMNLTSFI